MHPAQTRPARTQEETLMRKETPMRKLVASKGCARRSAQVGALALIVAAAAATAPNAVAATPAGALTWTAQTPIPTARGALASAVLDGNIYVLGGATSSDPSSKTLWRKHVSMLNTLESYNPQTKHWSTLPPLPTSSGFLAAASLNGQIYAIGGEDTAGDNLAKVESYSPGSGSWKTDAPLPAAKAGDHAAVGGGGRVYALDAKGGLEIYDPTTNSWTLGPTMPTESDLPGLAWSGNRLYAIGGLTAKKAPLDNVQVYDPATNTWQEKAPVPTRRGHPAVGTLADGQIIVAGGGPPFKITADVELYTPSSNTWQQLTALPMAMDPTGAVVGNKFYVISGFVNGAFVTTSVWAAVVQ
jgi:N-acetylneuraminic acid mutarotase